MALGDCDELTELNTSLNRSTAPINSPETPPRPKSRKSITLNTSLTSPTRRYSPSRQSSTDQKSILKPSRSSSLGPAMESQDQDPEVPARGRNSSGFAGNSTELYRTLEEFATEERLVPNRGEPAFCLRDIDEDDELYLMEIPRNLNPHELLGVTLDTDRSKKRLKISKEKYSWVLDDEPEVVTCVMPTGKERNPFRVVNVRATGRIAVARQETAQKSIKQEEDGEDRIPFPQDLKVRNPLLGEKAKKVKVKKVQVKEEREDSGEE